MARKKVPKALWDYGVRWVCKTMRLTYNTARGHEGCIPLEVVTGETPDISEYLDFGFYDKVWYHDNAGLGDTLPGRWLGVSHRVGSLMSYWVLTKKGRVISHTTVQRVTNLEMQTDEVKKVFKEYDEAIKGLLQDKERQVDGAKPNPEDLSDLYEFDQDFHDEFSKVVNDENIPEADDVFEPDMFEDNYVNMELAIPRDDSGPEYAWVTKRLKDANGLPIGRGNDNPILDTRMYEVEYSDGYKA